MRRNYLNYAGLAPVSKALSLQLMKFISDYYRIGPPNVVTKYREAIPGLSREAATLLNCRPDEISYIKNTTEGLIIAAEALPLAPGDEVLALATDYSANILPWLKRQQEGIRVFTCSGPNPQASFNSLIDRISARTRVVTVSWVQHHNGYCIDMARLSRACAEHDVFLVVDGIQIVGTRIINLDTAGIDILSCGGHKHLMSMMGSGILYVSHRVRDRLRPFKVGTRSVTRYDSSGFTLKSGTDRFEDGSPNLIGIWALYCSLRHLNHTGIARIAARNLELLEYAKSCLWANGLEFKDMPHQGNILALQATDPERLVQWLAKDKIIVKAVRDSLRVSFSYLNEFEDFDRCSASLKRALRHSEGVVH